MTEITMKSDSANPKKPNRLFIALVWSLGILALFALNLYAIEPLMSRVISPVAAQFFYVVLRVVGLVALAFALVAYARRNRFQTLTTVLLVGFIDQVFIKGLWLKRDMRIHPEAWKDFAPSNAALFVNLATGFLFFIPIVLILCFLGMESTRFRRDWKLNRKDLDSLDR